MFIEPGIQLTPKLRRSETSDFVEKAHCAPLELMPFILSRSYKHLGALGPGHFGKNSGLIG